MASVFAVLWMGFTESVTNSSSHPARFLPHVSPLFCSVSSVCFGLCCCCSAADGRDCLVLLIWQVSLPSCYLSVCVCYMCGCTRVPKSSSCLIHAMHTWSRVNPFTQALLWYTGFILWHYLNCLFAGCSHMKCTNIASCQTGGKQQLAGHSPHWNHICVLLPSYITTLFTSWTVNHQCNFHCPSEMAITTLLLYIHFIIWLICLGSIHPYWLR